MIQIVFPRTIETVYGKKGGEGGQVQVTVVSDDGSSSESALKAVKTREGSGSDSDALGKRKHLI